VGEKYEKRERERKKWEKGGGKIEGKLKLKM
jgi:hypothetical protein